MGDGENLGRKENKKREVSVREIKRQRERERGKVGHLVLNWRESVYAEEDQRGGCRQKFNETDLK